VQALLARGHESSAALVRRPSARRSSRRGAPKLVTGDVTDPASLRAAVDGCTHVVHLVAILKGSA